MPRSIKPESFTPGSPALPQTVRTSQFGYARIRIRTDVPKTETSQFDTIHYRPLVWTYAPSSDASSWFSNKGSYFLPSSEPQLRKDLEKKLFIRLIPRCGGFLQASQDQWQQISNSLKIGKTKRIGIHLFRIMNQPFTDALALDTPHKDHERKREKRKQARSGSMSRF